MESQPARILEPLIVPASLDPDAVKICRRLKRFGHEAYLVGGCVRDLSLGHIPKDFDVATSARPRQIKRLFRNARIIGRRFKLVHIQFGDKIIEVSTFRKNPNIDAETAADLDADRPPEADLPPEVIEGLDESEDAAAPGTPDGGEEAEPHPDEPAHRSSSRAAESEDRPVLSRGRQATTDDEDSEDVEPEERENAPRGRGGRGSNRRRGGRNSDVEDDSEEPIEDSGDDDGAGAPEDLLIRRDNVFGTAHEDAVRRDFTINALFYDVDDNVVIDYVGGGEDLARRVIRTIGDPVIRFQEDPVRILRAIKFAARLEFQIDPATYSAMVQYCGDLRKCAPPRLTEELLKILSCGAAHKAWALMRSIGVVETILPEIHDFIARTQSQLEDGISPGERIGHYLEIVDSADRGRRIFGNATLLTSLLAMPIREAIADQNGPRDPGMAADRVMRPFSQRMAISRRDAFRVKQIIVAQSRFRKPKNTRRRRRVKPIEFVRRDYFKDAFDFFRIESRASGEGNESDIRRWLDLWYGFLRQHHPADFHRAKREALFDETLPGAGGGDARSFDDDSADHETDHDDAEDSYGERNPQRQSANSHDEDVPAEVSDEDDGYAETADSHDASGEPMADDSSEPPGRQDHSQSAAQPNGERRGRRRRRGRRGRGRDRGEARNEPSHSGPAAEGSGDFSDRPNSGEGDGANDRRDESFAGGEPRDDRGARPNRSHEEQRPRNDQARGGQRGGRGPDERSRSGQGRQEHRGDRSDRPAAVPNRGDSRRDGDYPRDPQAGPEDSNYGPRNDGGHESNDRSSDRSGDGQHDDRRGGGRRRRRRGRRGGERSQHGEPQHARGEQGSAPHDEHRRDDGRRHGDSRGRGRELPPEPEPEEEEEIVEIPWDAPFQSVDDPGPISMIRTGVDQTEKKSRRRRRKLDGAARELSKEVEDQPALQAFKMIEGDPRGHEAPRPRRPKRKLDDDESRRDREPPFDFLRDFEAVESLFQW